MESSGTSNHPTARVLQTRNPSAKKSPRARPVTAGKHQRSKWAMAPAHGASAGYNSAACGLQSCTLVPQVLRLSSQSQRHRLPLWVPPKNEVSEEPDPTRDSQVWAAPCGLPAGLAPGPYQTAARGSPRPSGRKGALLTLVNLTSKLRMGRGRAGSFPSGCPFSTAPLVVAMAGLRSQTQGVRVPDALPGR